MRIYNKFLTVPAYKLTTPYGGWYITNKYGHVLACDNGFKWQDWYYGGNTRKNLDSWIITGIVEIKPFNNLGCRISLSEAIKIKNYTFKNGKPRYTIADIDHGTNRIHGNWNVHGLLKMYSV